MASVSTKPRSEEGHISPSAATDDTSKLLSHETNKPTQSSSDEIASTRQTNGEPERHNDTATEALGSPTEVSFPPDASRTAPTPTAAEDPEGKLPWYKRAAEKYGSISLENKGSVARDHLALERTFLAWLRTSLAFASIGIAITQLFRLNTSIASRSATQAYGGQPIARRDLPFSPMAGHSIPMEVIEQLQPPQTISSALALPKLGPTLLDQLLLLPARSSSDGSPGMTSSNNQQFVEFAFDEDAAKKLRQVGKPLGATFLAISIVVLLTGFHRYFESQHWIIRGKFPASRRSVALVTFMAAALIIASLVIVLVVAPSSFEK